jgi:hypothetical protein
MQAGLLLLTTLARLLVLKKCFSKVEKLKLCKVQLGRHRYQSVASATGQMGNARTGSAALEPQMLFLCTIAICINATTVLGMCNVSFCKS